MTIDKSMLLQISLLTFGYVAGGPIPEIGSLSSLEPRSDSGRNLGFGGQHVIISPSYSQVRRQGRKGDTRPIKVSIPSGGPNELDFILIGKEKEEAEENHPVFDNRDDSSLTPEDIKERIEEINEAEVQNWQTTVQQNEESLTTTESPFTNTETEQFFETTTPLVEREETETTTLTRDFGETVTTQPELSAIDTVSNTQPPTDEEARLPPEFPSEYSKRILVAIRSAFVPTLDLETISGSIEEILSVRTKVLLNAPPQVVQEEFKTPLGLIFMDLQLGPENEISANIYSDSQPLEQLQGATYEEAVKVLATVRSVLERNLEENKEVPTNAISAIPRKKIIVAIYTQLPIDENVVDKIHDSLDEEDTDVVVHINQPEEILQAETVGENLLPIFVSMIVGSEGGVSGNVYYNSVPLEGLYGPEAEESLDILITVKSLIEESLTQEIVEATTKDIEEITTNIPLEQERPEKIVIALKSENSFATLDIDDAIERIRSLTGKPTIILWNQPNDIVQTQVVGPFDTFLLDLKIDGNQELIGNIYKNFVPLENLFGEDFETSAGLLNLIRMVIQETLRVDNLDVETITESPNIDTTIRDEEDALTEITTDIIAESEIHTTNADIHGFENFNTEQSNHDIETTTAIADDSDRDIFAPIEEVNHSEDIITVETTQTSLDKEEFQTPTEIYTETQTEPQAEPEVVDVNNINGLLEEIQGLDLVDIEIHGERGFVTELPSHISSAATPGVDFGLIQEITS